MADPRQPDEFRDPPSDHAHEYGRGLRSDLVFAARAAGLHCGVVAGDGRGVSQDPRRQFLRPTAHDSCGHPRVW